MPRITTQRHKVGDAENGFLWADSSNGLHEAIFEDDGETGYFDGLDVRDEGNRATTPLSTRSTSTYAGTPLG